jgi:hypothetical protein
LLLCLTELIGHRQQKCIQTRITLVHEWNARLHFGVSSLCTMTNRQRPLPRRGIFALAAIVSYVWMTASPTATTTALIVRDDTSSVEGVLSPATNVCTSITSSYMVCNPDPLVLYQKIGYASAPPNGQIDLGVKQRIDGNDAEIEGIKKVIKLMNQYFVEEVLSMYEYGLIVPKWYAVGKGQTCRISVSAH